MEFLTVIVLPHQRLSISFVNWNIASPGYVQDTEHIFRHLVYAYISVDRGDCLNLQLTFS